MSSNIDKLAEILMQFKNQNPPQVAFGKVVSCSPPKIQLSDNNVVLTSANFKTNVNLDERDAYGNYIHMGKTVSMITYLNNHKYLVLGVIC